MKVLVNKVDTLDDGDVKGSLGHGRTFALSKEL